MNMINTTHKGHSNNQNEHGMVFQLPAPLPCSLSQFPVIHSSSNFSTNTQQIFIEHLLSARIFTMKWKYMVNGTSPFPKRVYIL